MRHAISLTPSISHVLDDLRGRVPSGPGTGRPALRQARFATDLLGMSLFFVLLGTYLMAHL
jgi:hypothetical protein